MKGCEEFWRRADPAAPSQGGHPAGCPSCKKELSLLADGFEALKEELLSSEPAPADWTRVHARVLEAAAPERALFPVRRLAALLAGGAAALSIALSIAAKGTDLGPWERAEALLRPVGPVSAEAGAPDPRDLEDWALSVGGPSDTAGT